MKLTPLHDKLLVLPDDPVKESPGGIIIPTLAEEKSRHGIVVAAGNGLYDKERGTIRPLDVKEGDRVLFSKFGGTDIKIDGVEHLIMRESDILGIITEL